MEEELTNIKTVDLNDKVDLYGSSKVQIDIDKKNINKKFRIYNRLITLNKKWSQILGWDKRDIEKFVFGTKLNLNYYEFIDLVADWQFRNNIKVVDGIIGKITFVRMLESCKLLQDKELSKILKRFDQVIFNSHFREIKFFSHENDLKKLKDFWTIVSFPFESKIFEIIGKIKISKNVKINTIFRLGKIYKFLTKDFNAVKFYRFSLDGIRKTVTSISQANKFTKSLKVSKSYKVLSRFVNIIETARLTNELSNAIQGREIKTSTIIESIVLAISFEKTIGAPTAAFYNLGNLVFDFSGKFDTVSDILTDAVLGDYYKSPKKIILDNNDGFNESRKIYLD